MLPRQVAKPPKDNCYAVFMVQILHGMSLMLLMQILMTCFSFFNAKFPDEMVESRFPFAINFTIFIGTIFFTFYGTRCSPTPVIITCFIGQIISAGIFPMISNQGGHKAFWICFVLLMTAGLCTGLTTGALFATSAKLPSSYIGIFMTATGASGLVVSILRLISLLAWPGSAPGSDSAYKSVLFMFYVGIAVSAMCIFGQIVMARSKFAQYYINRKGNDEFDILHIDEASTSLGQVHPEDIESDDVTPTGSQQYGLLDVNYTE